jgi:hypothetical protein
MAGYDVIGDIHGQADKLRGLLSMMGYTEQGGVWQHRERIAVFVGDLIDRGPMQAESIDIPRAMVEAGKAHIVLGNHEFNAIAYATRNADDSDWLRTHHGEKGQQNAKTHDAFLEQIGFDTPRSRDVLDWFRTIPLWLDLGGLRVIHACWHQPSIDHMAKGDGGAPTLTDRILLDGTTKEHPTYDATEVLIKGPEIDLDGRVYLDKGGHRRSRARRRWWDASATTLRAAALIPGGTTEVDGKTPFAPLAETPLDGDDSFAYDGDVPVIVGHYWETGTPTTLTDKAACVDYSAFKGGPLVAYQWDGETNLDDAKFVVFGQTD